MVSPKSGRDLCYLPAPRRRTREEETCSPEELLPLLPPSLALTRCHSKTAASAGTKTTPIILMVGGDGSPRGSTTKAYGATWAPTSSTRTLMEETAPWDGDPSALALRRRDEVLPAQQDGRRDLTALPAAAASDASAFQTGFPAAERRRGMWRLLWSELGLSLFSPPPLGCSWAGQVWCAVPLAPAAAVRTQFAAKRRAPGGRCGGPARLG